MPLTIKCHTLPRLTALTSGLEPSSSSGPCSPFTLHQTTLKRTHFPSWTGQKKFDENVAVESFCVRIGNCCIERTVYIKCALLKDSLYSKTWPKTQNLRCPKFSRFSRNFWIFLFRCRLVRWFSNFSYEKKNYITSWEELNVQFIPRIRICWSALEQ